MAILQYVPALFSSLFRVCVFIFLRVIPTSYAKTASPVLFASYLVSLGVSSFQKQPKSDDAQKVEIKEEGSAKDIKEDEARTAKPETPTSTRSHEPLLELLLALPSPDARIRFANFALNGLLLLAVVEFTAYPFFDAATDVVFTRVGAVYPDAAKIVVRYPQTNATTHDVRIVWRQQKVANSDSWKEGPVLSLLESDDWVNTAKLSGLWPSTPYEYKLWSTEKEELPYPADPIRFRTFPDPRLPSGSHFRFVASSCSTPNFPYVPLHGRTIKGFDLLAQYLWPQGIPAASPPLPSATSEPEPDPLESETDTNITTNITPVNETTPSTELIDAPSTEFLLFMGDFIYADVPIYFGDDKEAYRRLYRRNYQSPSFRKVYEHLPVFHTYDDHEIINNFAGLANDSTPPFANASDPFRLYNAQANFDSVDAGQYYYDFRYGDVAFFVLDTRRYRSGVSDDHDPSARTMLGDKQLAALHNWLAKANTTASFKFIVSSVPFTDLWGHDAQVDAWPAYAHEKAQLLEALHSVTNVIILSGDRHEFADIQFNSPEETGHAIREFSTSPMSMFYIPFIRTLKAQSTTVVRRTHYEVKVVEGSEEPEIVETVEEIPQEQVLKYLPTGNHKWSTIEIDTRNLDAPVLKLEVVIDGSIAYEYTIVGDPVKLRSSTALGAFVPQSFRGMLDKIGMKPSTWF
ncbi:hypothetical protein PLICRDRAFT_124950 [Plicaturopsis crispa FD-325 SS-3]|nr:hypothetical protein PLICRDRAFT_124950 [Plicaturopsis crispa FD-325 SS-3]